MIKIYVGPTEREYALPKDLLCYYSLWFVAYLNEGFREAKEGIIQLPENEPRYFDIFVQIHPDWDCWIVTTKLAHELRTIRAKETIIGKSAMDCLDFLRLRDKCDIHEMVAT